MARMGVSKSGAAAHYMFGYMLVGGASEWSVCVADVRTGRHAQTRAGWDRGTDDCSGVSAAWARLNRRGILGVYIMAAPLGSLTDRYGPRM